MIGEIVLSVAITGSDCFFGCVAGLSGFFSNQYFAVNESPTLTFSGNKDVHTQEIEDLSFTNKAGKYRSSFCKNNVSPL